MPLACDKFDLFFSSLHYRHFDCGVTQDTLFDLENGGGEQLDDSDLNEDVAKLRCESFRCWDCSLITLERTRVYFFVVGASIFIVWAGAVLD